MRATQHIPDIVQLQQFLHDRYNHRLYKSEAVNKTFKAIEKELKGTTLVKLPFTNFVIYQIFVCVCICVSVCVYIYRTSEVKNSFNVRRFVQSMESGERQTAILWYVCMFMNKITTLVQINPHLHREEWTKFRLVT